MFNHVEKFEFPQLVRENFEGKRVYKTESGDRFPSVTTVLGHKSKPAIKAWRKRVGAETANKISRQASVRGTKIHSLCEDYVNNDDLDFDKLSFVEVDMFNQMKPLIDRIDNIHCVEQFLYSEHLRLAGQATASLSLMVDYLSSTSKPLPNPRVSLISRITLPSVPRMQLCLRNALVSPLTHLLSLLVSKQTNPNYL